MVMDPPSIPSAQRVGQEFVRQYYTLLHEAPTFMHRFYSHDSSYVHGGIEKPGEELPPVVGQAEIHKKIQSMNFRDCHAKIRQVDSQSTIDHAVLVQVAGELSNDGQPMRRFMQSFVLAPQSPKKYYVYNDIFRYQDEVFHDGDSEADVESDYADSISYSGGDGVCLTHESGDHEQEQLTLRESQMTLEEEPQQAFVDPSRIFSRMDPSQGDVERDGQLVEEPMCVQIRHTDPDPVLSTAASRLGDAGNDVPMQVVSPRSLAMEAGQQQSGGALGKVSSNSVLHSTSTGDLETESYVCEGPKPAVSWAALASKNAMGSTTVPPPPKPQATVKPEVKPDVVMATPAPLPQRLQRLDQRSSLERDNGDADDRSRLPIYPDDQQLFVGNLPHSITNEELKEFFGQFGQVVDVRINRKGAIRDVPNFGFITFDSTEVVQKVLTLKPLYLGNKHRLNIEEKKLPSDMGGGGGPMRGGGGRGGDIQRGGFKGYAPQRGGGVVSFRGGRGTWRGRARGTGGNYSSYRSNNDINNDHESRGGDIGDGYSSQSSSTFHP